MKTALITGGTSGIGLSIAKALITKQYKVVIIGKKLEKGKIAESQLNAIVAGSANFMQLNLGSISDVKDFTNRFKQQYSSLDVLANIAGVMSTSKSISVEGVEQTFAINYLSAYILTTELAGLLESAPNGRVVNVAGLLSDTDKWKVNFADVDGKDSYSFPASALRALHAKTVLTAALAEQLKPKGIDVNSFHPGIVRSELMNNLPWFMRTLSKMSTPFLPASSNTGIYVASAEALNGVSGKIFSGQKGKILKFEASYQAKLLAYTESIVAP